MRKHGRGFEIVRNAAVAEGNVAEPPGNILLESTLVELQKMLRVQQLFEESCWMMELR